MEEQNNNEKTIWQEFNLNEKQWDAIANQLENAEINANDLVEYCKNAFPTSIENQVKAFIIAMDYHEWQSEEENDEEELDINGNKINSDINGNVLE